MKESPGMRVALKREQLIADACEPLARDLMAIDPFSYALFLHLGQVPETYELINAMVARHFRKGSLEFSVCGECLIAWARSPVVALDFEFAHDGVRAFFRLVIAGTKTAIELHHIAFERLSGENLPERLADGSDEQLSRALSDARIAA